MSFKKGDKVMLVSEDNWLTNTDKWSAGWSKNTPLTVREVRPGQDGNPPCLIFEELYGKHPSHARFADKFELVKPQPIEPLTPRGSGAKWDGGKPMFDLFGTDCANAHLGIVQVMTWAVEVKGYVPGSWQTVPEALKRYGAALDRHQNAKRRGERYDKESGLLHDFHIATNAVFVAELEARVDLAAGKKQEYNKSLPTA